MNWQKIKTAKEITLKGLTVELHRADDNLIGVRLTDVDGKFIEVSKDGWDSWSLRAPAPPKMESRWVVCGAIEGVEIQPQTFETSREAELFIEQRKSANFTASLTVEEKEIPVES